MKRQALTKGARYVAMLLSISMLILQSPLMLWAQTSAPSSFKDLQVRWQETIGEGTVLTAYEKVWPTENNNKTLVYVTTVDLNNPYVEVKPLYGTDHQLTQKQNVVQMAREEGAIAAVNADFFRMDQKGLPFGMVVRDSELVSSMGFLSGWASLGITTDRQAIISQFGFQGHVTAQDGATFSLRGVNKEEYYPTQGTSHVNQLNMYTPDFGKKSLGITKEYHSQVVEVVVEDGYVIDIRQNQEGAMIPSNGFVLWGQGVAAQFLLTHVHMGDEIHVDYAVTPYDLSQLQQAVGGHAQLVKDGQVVSKILPRVDGKQPRTAVGVSQDGKRLLLVTVEGSKYSRGLTMEELAQLMFDLGSYQAVNFDGGGSTTLAAQRLAETQATLINNTKYGGLRAVPTALGIFNTAPKGALAGFKVMGPEAVFIGEQAAFQIKGYDEHYHPYTASNEEITWSHSQGEGTWDGNRFTPKQSGTMTISAQINGIEGKKQITVLGGKDIARLQIQPDPIYVVEQGSLPLHVEIVLKNGRILKATPQQVNWRVEGNIGTVKVEENQSIFYAGSASGKGRLIASIDGFQAAVPVHVGSAELPWLTMDNLRSPHFKAYSTGEGYHVTGAFTTTKEHTELFRTRQGTVLSYDFTQANPADVSIAYGMLGDKPVTMPGQPLGLGVWVKGDESQLWLRASVRDASGKVHYVDLSNSIDWNGWQKVVGWLPGEISYPVALESLYLVYDPKITGQSLKGTIYLDEVSLFHPYTLLEDVVPITLPAGWDGKAAHLALGEELIASVIRDGKLNAPLTITPQSAAMTSVPSYVTADYGFYVDGKEENLPQAITIQLQPNKWVSGKGVGLLERKTDGSWAVVAGDYAKVAGKEGAFQFTISKPGLYMPYYQDHPVYFTDLKGNPAKNAAYQLAIHGYIQGVSKEQFAPDASLTRAQWLTLLGRLLNWELNDQNTGEDPLLQFSDEIPTWATPAVRYAVQHGIAKGYETGQFLPNKQVTTEEMILFLQRALQQKNLLQNTDVDQVKLSFSDQGKIATWALPAVKEVYQGGYLSHIKETLQPKKEATRGEAARLLYQVFIRLK